MKSKKEVKMQKRGQAAMEFLMTYGWAILAAIIVIAVLAIYFRPSQFRPEGILVSAPFSQGSGLITDGAPGADSAVLELRNSGGEVYNNVNISLDITSPPGAICDSNDGLAPIDSYQIASWAPGTLNVTTFVCTGLNSDDSFVADISIRYTPGGSTLSLTSEGQASFKVE